jgi:SNF2 family DNA or RNA helicase
VTVTRFLARDTIEQRIDQILADKREMFDTILGSADGPRNVGLNKAEVFSLFNLRFPSGAIERQSPTG